LQADISLTGAAEKLVAETVAKFGRLDVLVNNAGGLVARTLVGELDDAFYDRVMDLNVRSLVHTSQAAILAMRKSGGGSIINVSSISARTGGSPGSSIYSGAKAFVSTFTRSLGRGAAPGKIRVKAK
jgi:3-oxoacyl-[acyl-carrier protein] reductase